MTTHATRSLVAFAVLALCLLIGGAVHNAAAAPTTITAFKSQLPVKIDGVADIDDEWRDTPMVTDQTSGITFGAKENGTGLLFLMQWNQSATYCTDSSCFGGIELGSTNNTLAMGSARAPTIMILASPNFKGAVDEFISIGSVTPLTVESKGYATQSICALGLAGSRYTAECYRPFTLSNASPYDFNLGPGSSLEIGFAVGEFSTPGLHHASNMLSYLLTISSQDSGLLTTSSSTGASSTSSTSSTSTQAPAGPSALDYSLELGVIVVGFTFFVLVLMLRYQRS